MVLIGQKFYRLISLQVYEYTVIEINKRKELKLASKDKEGRIRTRWVSNRIFEAHYKMFKIPLLRELMLRLEDVIQETAIEINAYELTIIMNKYKIK